MILPDDELTELEAKERASTPGPWKPVAWIEADGNSWRACGPSCDPVDDDDYGEPGCDAEQQAQRDADLIAALRNAAPALIAAARRERRLEVVVKVVLDTWLTSHSMHWDKEGTHGANCPACVLDRDARAQLRAAVEEK